MDEISKIISFFSNSNSEAAVRSPVEPNSDLARKYLQKYWLPMGEYLAQWKPLQDQIFINQDQGLPALAFQQAFKIFILRGGALFSREDFEKLQCCMRAIGNKHFVVIQNTYKRKFYHWLPLRMKYPVDINWIELMSGDFISTALLKVPHYEYFVFAETAVWGKYTDSEECDLDIVGFLPDYESVFKQNFAYSKAEETEIKSWRAFPPAYANIEVRKGAEIKEKND